MYLLWHGIKEEDKDDIESKYTMGIPTSKKWHEESLEDTEPLSASNAVFFASPFALGMDPSGYNISTDIPFPGEGAKGEGKPDLTSLKLGERGILNPLWQYNMLADPRTAGIAAPYYGRVYNKRIRPNNPIVFIQPGKPKFFGLTQTLFGGLTGGISGSDADHLRTAILEKNFESDSELGVQTFTLEDFLTELTEDSTTIQTDGKSGPMKFYDFQPDFKTYRMYVSGILNELMVRMHIDIPATAYGEGLFNTVNDYLTMFSRYYGFWDFADAMNNNKSNYLSKPSFIPFRVEKSTDAGDSFDNTTGQSAAAEKAKGISDQAKEVLFLTNDAHDGKGFSLSGAANALGGIAGTLSGTAESVIKSGGNLLFPEIWKESTYSKNITIQIKLHAPNGEPNCYIENILFPIACILGFIMPRQSDSSVYSSPPLIRMYSKGWFSCDMGMITSVSIKRGSDTNDWTISRLARTVEITLTVKDLFGTLVMSMSHKWAGRTFFNKNSMLRDYLNVLGGVDAFASSTLSSRWQNAWKAAKFKFQRFFDPRTWIAGVASNPLLGIPARIVTGVRDFFQ